MTWYNLKTVLIFTYYAYLLHISECDRRWFCLWFAVHVVCLEPIQFTWGYTYTMLWSVQGLILHTHTEVDRCISKICKVDWLPCYEIIQYHIVKLSPTSFTLHSCPPHITGASVGSCAGPSILTGFGTQCCVGSNERTRLQLYFIWDVKHASI